MKYDTIIIGAGLSGLAAGIRLAYYDRRVCIVERHTTIGGLNSFYRLRKRDYDVGLHAVTNYADRGAKGKPLTKLLRQLRLSWDDFALCPQIESAVVFPDCRLRMNNDFELLTSQVAKNFPEQIDGFRKLVAYIDGYDPFASTEGYQSAREVVKSYISDPLLENMLFCPILFYSSATPNDLDLRQFVIIFRSILQEGFARPYEGIRRILRVLIKKFRGEGGELKLRTGVKRILHNEQGAYAIETDSGEILEADNILSSAGLVETQRLCEKEFVSEEDSTGQISFVESISSLDCEPSDLGHRDTIVFFSTQTDFRYENPPTPVDLRSGIICSPNNYQFDEPLEYSKINITALADFHYWLGLEDEEVYQSEKQKHSRAMIDNAVKLVPDFRGHIIDQDVFTPRTIRKFTGHINGAVYGSPTKQLSGTTPIPHLYLCGTDQGFLGIIGSMLSGISMANAHLLK
ncbi:MAG TPA: NAD(P)/FAD-dependent oxidoreductase [Planctomycetaceae bacterium]|nr:NAD(P)/FAD-dependent oxidoreductase [Planctomycetaceae bacterium]